jgi:hypothetical protein
MAYGYGRRRVGRPRMRSRRGGTLLSQNGSGRRRRRGGSVRTMGLLRSMSGVGRRRRTRRGRGIGDLLRSAHAHIKKHRYVSRGLHALSKHISHPGLVRARNVAATLGYGLRRRRRTRRSGRGFFSNVGNFFRNAYNTVKDSRLLSRGLSLIPHAGAQTAGRVAHHLGLGRRRRSRRMAMGRRRRGGAMSALNGRLFLV